LHPRFAPELLNLPIKVINCLVEKKMLKLAIKLEKKQQLLKLKPAGKNQDGLFYEMSTSKLPTIKMLTSKLPTIKMSTSKLPTIKMLTSKLPTIKITNCQNYQLSKCRLPKG
jgi:hypothetical protein